MFDISQLQLFVAPFCGQLFLCLAPLLARRGSPHPSNVIIWIKWSYFNVFIYPTHTLPPWRSSCVLVPRKESHFSDWIIVIVIKMDLWRLIKQRRNYLTIISFRWFIDASCCQLIWRTKTTLSAFDIMLPAEISRYKSINLNFKLNGKIKDCVEFEIFQG